MSDFLLSGHLAVGVVMITSATAALVLAQPQDVRAETSIEIADQTFNSHNVLLGAYDPHGTFGSSAELAIEHIYMPWRDANWDSLRAADNYALSRNRALLITVEPWSWSDQPRSSSAQHLADISDGKFDSDIAAVCQAAGGLNSQVTIRWAHEMEDTSGRYPWSGAPGQAYIDAYRHFVNECRKHFRKAQFMWSPKGDATLAQYYPGDHYVDSVGVALFGLQQYDLDYFGRDRSFSEAFRERYSRVAAFGKPVILAELGFNGDDRYLTQWAEEIACTGDEFPLLRGILFFNEVETYPWPAGYGRPDWRIGSDRIQRECRLERPYSSR